MNISNRKPTIYVAGPMRGYENYNFPAFDRCSRVLREQGWNVINPAELDKDAGKPMSDPCLLHQTQTMKIMSV